MNSPRAPSRKPRYRTPDQQIREQDQRRLEIMKDARLQSVANGYDEFDFIEALLIREAAERARGDPARALFIFDMEMEQVQRDQTLDAIERFIIVVKEIAAEVLAASPDYKTVAEDAECS